MPKGSPQLTAAREEEIVNACERLYAKMCFKDITLLHISQETSFTRTSIYNYFNTKEEIFLALFKKEYDRWNEDLLKMLKEEISSPEKLADKLSSSLQDRVQLLKLLSMNVYDMEAHSRPEMLCRFKQSYAKAICTARKLFAKILPSAEAAEDALFCFFPFMNGIYPYCHATPKQIEAMEKAGLKYSPKTVHDLTYNFLCRILIKIGEKMNFIELAKKRYSVRKFSDKPVEAEKLAKILEAGNIAPTAKNQQPHRIYVLQSQEAIEKMAKLTPCLYGAKTALLFTYNTEEEWNNPMQQGIHSGVEDVSIVATHIMLAAADLGLGTCWVNYFPNTQTEKAFSLPANEKAVLVMPIGYAAEDSKPAPGHEACKPLENTVKYI